jgi:hypothetical protein
MEGANRLQVEIQQKAIFISDKKKNKCYFEQFNF